MCMYTRVYVCMYVAICLLGSSPVRYGFSLMPRLCWLVAPDHRGRFSECGPSARTWQFKPPLLDEAGWAVVNAALTRSGFPPWTRGFERRKRNGWSLLMEADQWVAGWEDCGDQVQRSCGRVVAAMIIDSPHFSGESLAHASEEHRVFYKGTETCFRDGLVVHRVLHVMAISKMGWPGSDLSSDAMVLTPTPVERRGQVRTAVFRTVMDNVQDWLQLPCYNAANKTELGTVQQAVQNLRESFGIEIHVTDICWSVWHPILLSIVHGEWHLLASALPTLDHRYKTVAVRNKKRTCAELYEDLDLSHQPTDVINLFEGEPQQQVLRQIATMCRSWWPFIKAAGYGDGSALYQQVFANEVCEWLSNMADKIEFPFAQRDDVGEGEVLRRTELAAVTLVRYLALSSLMLNNSELPTLLRRTLKSLLFDSKN